MTTQRNAFRTITLCVAIAALGGVFVGCTSAPAAKEAPSSKEAAQAVSASRDAAAAQKAPDAVAYTPGVYTASAEGIGGMLTVQVTFSATAITEVKVLNDNETEGVGKVAVEELPAKIVAGQTLNVDAVSGATVSSQAILAAVEECVKKAGGDVAALKAK